MNTGGVSLPQREDENSNGYGDPNRFVNGQMLYVMPDQHPSTSSAAMINQNVAPPVHQLPSQQHHSLIAHHQGNVANGQAMMHINPINHLHQAPPPTPHQLHQIHHHQQLAQHGYHPQSQAQPVHLPHQNQSQLLHNMQHPPVSNHQPQHQKQAVNGQYNRNLLEEDAARTIHQAAKVANSLMGLPQPAVNNAPVPKLEGLPHGAVPAGGVPRKKAAKIKQEDTGGPAKRPDSNSTVGEIVNYLMKYNMQKDDEDFSRKALESLHKKIKDRPQDMETLITAVETFGTVIGGCITVQRTLDGRLQVAGRKGFPHVIYARIFRFADLHKNELKHTPLCKFGFDSKNEVPQDSMQQVCVNPYHYERVTAPSVGGGNDMGGSIGIKTNHHSMSVDGRHSTNIMMDHSPTYGQHSGHIPHISPHTASTTSDTPTSSTMKTDFGQPSTSRELFPQQSQPLPQFKVPNQFTPPPLPQALQGMRVVTPSTPTTSVIRGPAEFDASPHQHYITAHQMHQQTPPNQYPSSSESQKPCPSNASTASSSTPSCSDYPKRTHSNGENRAPKRLYRLENEDSKDLYGHKAYKRAEMEFWSGVKEERDKYMVGRPVRDPYDIHRPMAARGGFGGMGIKEEPNPGNTRHVYIPPEQKSRMRWEQEHPNTRTVWNSHTMGSIHDPNNTSRLFPQSHGGHYTRDQVPYKPPNMTPQDIVKQLQLRELQRYGSENGQSSMSSMLMGEMSVIRKDMKQSPSDKMRVGDTSDASLKEILSMDGVEGMDDDVNINAPAPKRNFSNPDKLEPQFEIVVTDEIHEKLKATSKHANNGTAAKVEGGEEKVKGESNEQQLVDTYPNTCQVYQQTDKQREEQEKKAQERGYYKNGMMQSPTHSIPDHSDDPQLGCTCVLPEGEKRFSCAFGNHSHYPPGSTMEQIDASFLLHRYSLYTKENKGRGALYQFAEQFNCPGICMKRRANCEPEPAKDIPAFYNWCAVSYYEKLNQIGEMKQVTNADYFIDGGVNGIDERRYCVGSLPNPHLNADVAYMRSRIGAGVRISAKSDGSVWVRCLSRFAVFVQSSFLDREAGRVAGDAVHKIYPGGAIKVFDLVKCRDMILQQFNYQASAAKIHTSKMKMGELKSPLALFNRRELRRLSRMGGDDLQRLAIIKVSFMKGWGPDYERKDITECPAWIEIIMNRACDYIDHLMNTSSPIFYESENDSEEYDSFD